MAADPYADDVAHMIKGNFLNTCTSLRKAIVSVVTNWAAGSSFTNNP